MSPKQQFSAVEQPKDVLRNFLARNTVKGHVLFCHEESGPDDEMRGKLMKLRPDFIGQFISMLAENGDDNIEFHRIQSGNPSPSCIVICLNVNNQCFEFVGLGLGENPECKFPDDNNIKRIAV